MNLIVLGLDFFVEMRDLCGKVRNCHLSAAMIVLKMISGNTIVYKLFEYCRCIFCDSHVELLGPMLSGVSTRVAMILSRYTSRSQDAVDGTRQKAKGQKTSCLPVALAILMKFDGTLMPLEVKEPCRDTERNNAAQNLSVQPALRVHFSFGAQVLFVS